MYIDGQWFESGDVFDVFNPANSEKIGEVANAEREDGCTESKKTFYGAWWSCSVYCF